LQQLFRWRELRVCNEELEALLKESQHPDTRRASISTTSATMYDEFSHGDQVNSRLQNETSGAPSGSAQPAPAQ
jgi:hypothetical protein